LLALEHMRKRQSEKRRELPGMRSPSRVGPERVRTGPEIQTGPARNDHRGLDAELVRLAGVAFSQTLDLGGMQRVELVGSTSDPTKFCTPIRGYARTAATTGQESSLPTTARA
jgi:hypothetical protein